MNPADELDQFAHQLLDAISRMDALVNKTFEVQERCESIKPIGTSDQLSVYPAVF